MSLIVKDTDFGVARRAASACADAPVLDTAPAMAVTRSSAGNMRRLRAAAECPGSLTRCVGSLAPILTCLLQTTCTGPGLDRRCLHESGRHDAAVSVRSTH